MKKPFAFIFLPLFAAAPVHAQPITGGQIDQQIAHQPVQTDTTSGWQVVFSYPGIRNGFSIAALQFPSKDTGYAGVWNGTNNVLLRSTNGGITWDSLPTPVPGGHLAFVTPLLGFCNGSVNNSVIWKTIDGGMSWTFRPRNANAAGPIAFSNRDTGVAVGTTEIARTTDGGETWSKVFPKVDALVNAATFGDSKTGYGVGDAGVIPPHTTNTGYCEKTTDGGATWQYVYTGIPGDLVCAAAINANTFIVGCGNPWVGRTTNGGLTWDSVYIDHANNAHISEHTAMSFTKNGHGFVVGDNDRTGITQQYGLIFASIDSGKTWKEQYALNLPALYGVVSLNDSVALVCGGGNIYRTTTGGNFSSVSQTRSPDFQVQVFPNPAPGVVTIQFQLASPSQVSFRFYNISGATIGLINAGMQIAGVHRQIFDGSALAIGVYYFQLATPQGSYTGQFTIQK